MKQKLRDGMYRDESHAQTISFSWKVAGTKSSIFYLFDLTVSEAGTEKKRALGLLLTPQELLQLKQKDFGLSSQIFQLLKT